MDNEDAGRRVGTFFLVLGIIALTLFGASDVAGSTYYPLFCGGGFLLLVGWFIRVRNRAPEQNKAGGRFGLFRRKPKQDKEEPKKQ